MPNRLIHETSPYLLQHSNNPVDWYSWGDEALEKARLENKPIFLSIGYAACHWCHVMEHESFENPETAALLNRYFISIKVDREERPDLDQIYMEAVVAMTGQGGWPMSVFLTPDGKPFYGGTYFPPDRRHGLPAFKEVLTAVARTWAETPDELVEAGHQLFQHIEASANWRSAKDAPITVDLMLKAASTLLENYDWQFGGWGSSPRFPASMAIEFLLMQHSRGVPDTLKPALHALDQMSRGGMYDVVGGGFHRYSTDDRWLVPHFEKMLYDNALLSLVYLHAYQITADESYRHICEETLDFILRELTHTEGGFFSSLDADSEGEEGIFYLWTAEELKAALNNSQDFEFLRRVYAIGDHGNFEGKFILQKTANQETLASAAGLPPEIFRQKLDQIHTQLRQFRGSRTRPATDDKVLTFWNALTLHAFAEAGRVLKRSSYIEAARKNAGFLMGTLHPQDRLLRSWRAGKAHLNAYLEDYAALIIGLLSLYESDPDIRWYRHALTLAEEMIQGFKDEKGGFYNTRSDHGALLIRPKDIQDNATPSGNSLAARALLVLHAFSGREEFLQLAQSQFGALQDVVVNHPTAFANWLQAMDFSLGPVKQIAILWPPDQKDEGFLETALNLYLPRSVWAESPYPVHPNAPDLLKNRSLVNGQTTAFVCEGFVCRLPATTPEVFSKQLNG